MRDFSHSDGSVTIRTDDDDEDVIHAKAVVGAFAPVAHSAFCACGAPLRPWALRPTSTCVAELMCCKCLRTLGTFQLAVITRR